MRSSSSLHFSADSGLAPIEVRETISKRLYILARPFDEKTVSIALYQVKNGFSIELLPAGLASGLNSKHVSNAQEEEEDVFSISLFKCPSRVAHVLTGCSLAESKVILNLVTRSWRELPLCPSEHSVSSNRLAMTGKLRPPGESRDDGK